MSHLLCPQGPSFARPLSREVLVCEEAPVRVRAVWKPGLHPPAGLSGICWGHSRRTWGVIGWVTGLVAQGSWGSLGRQSWETQGGGLEPGREVQRAQLWRFGGRSVPCLTWPCCFFLSALDPCAWCVGPTSVLMCFGVKPRAVSPFRAESGSHSTRGSLALPCPTSPSCGFTTPCSYLRAHLFSKAPSCVSDLQGTQCPCGDGIWACALRSASGQISGPGLCQLLHLSSGQESRPGGSQRWLCGPLIAYVPGAHRPPTQGHTGRS